MQAASPRTLPGPYVDFSLRNAAWKLGQGVNVSVSGLALLGLCSMVIGSPQSLSGAIRALPAPAPAPMAATALPDQLLAAAGLPSQGRVLALAAPLWGMRPVPDVGEDAEMVLGSSTSATMTLRNSVGKEVWESYSSPGLPAGQAVISQSGLMVSTSELLLYQYLSVWADAVPAAFSNGMAGGGGGGGGAWMLASGQQLAASSMEGMLGILDALLPMDKWQGSPAFKAYSPAPRVVHIVQWAPMPSGNSIQVGLHGRRLCAWP